MKRPRTWSRSRVESLFGGVVIGASMIACSGCDGPLEATQVELPAFVDSSGLAEATTDLGYVVELTEARAMIADLTFSIRGELHTALWRTGAGFLVPTAYAHPGHPQGGEITGELPGRFALDWVDGATADLGPATLLTGTYDSANFRFARAQEEDGFDADDRLLGHTAVLHGRASRGAEVFEFTAILDSPEGRELVGAPFEFEVDEVAREFLGVRLLTADPIEGDTLFDGIDFAALDPDRDGHVRIEPGSRDPAAIDAYNRLRRTFQTHDHFDVRPVSPAEVQEIRR